MSDTEMLNLIEHYGWTIKFIDGGCHIILHQAGTHAFAKSIRDAVKIALDAQIKWSVG